MTTIEDLSPEMLVEIFSHYIESEGYKEFQRNVVPVCKTWLSFSSAPTLWKSINVKDWNYALSLSKRGLLNNTKTLNIYGWPSDPLLPLTVLSSVRDLKSLKISQAEFSPNTMMIVAKLCPNLENLHMQEVDLGEFQPLTLEELNPILTKCGPKLKHLSLIDCGGENSKELVTEIAAKCPNLEVFEWADLDITEVPIYKLASGCPRLQKLVLSNCEFVTEGEKVCSGFRDLRMFKTEACHFHGLDVCSLLKNSNNLEHLQMKNYENLIFSDFSKIPSNKVRFLDIYPSETEAKSLQAVAGAVAKWKHTLLHLEVMGCDITEILQGEERMKKHSSRIEEINREFVQPLMNRVHSMGVLIEELPEEVKARLSWFNDQLSVSLTNDESLKAYIREGAAWIAQL